MKVRRPLSAVLALTLAVVLAPAPAGTVEPIEDVGPIRRILVVTLPGVTWSEMRSAHLPHTENLVREAAVGVMSTQIGRGPASTPAAYLTLGAGTRSVDAGVDTGIALNPDELHGGVPAADILMRRLGRAPEGIAYLPVGAALDVNSRSPYGGVPGTLGDLLDGAGVERAVIANADAAEGFASDEPPPDGAYSRSAATFLMGTDGIVPHGDVGRGLLLEDPDAPFGRRFSPEVVLATFESVWDVEGPAVVVVEASDLSRAAGYARRSTPDQARALREQALRDADGLLGDLLDHVDPASDAVLVLSPVARSGAGMAVLRAPSVDGGLLRSATTRRDGYVHLADVAPSILTLMGVEPPTAMEGRSFDVAGAEGNRVTTLIDQGEAARARDERLPTVVQVIIAFLALLVLAVVQRDRLPRGGASVLRAVAIGALGIVPGTFLTALFPATVDSAVAYVSVVVTTAVVVGVGGGFLDHRRPGVGVLFGLGVVVTVIGIDLVLGAHLQVNTVFGYSTAVAGRFAGLGNLAFALFSAAGLALAVSLVDRYGERALPGAIGLLAAVVLLDGLPMLGADVGGVASMVPAFAVTAMLLGGRRPSGRHVVAFAAAALVAVAVFGLLDASRPASSQTHLARLGEHLVHGRFDAVRDTFVRRLQASFGSSQSAIWVIALGAIAVAGIHAVAHARGWIGPRATRWSRDRFATALAVGAAVLAGLGLVVNDSSIAVPATMLIVFVPVLVLRQTTPDEGAAR